MPARINRLPASLANQIAAGEVIERPASVVKELLENSLDAAATSIQLDIEKGGAQQIRVSDNGHGIHPDDMQLAMERHATSKLREQADLERINSLGFRGEALPSMASVSQFKLISRRLGMEQAWAVVVDPLSNKLERMPAAHPVGTTIEVSNLFHVTPARRRFLGSERTEFLHILAMVRRLALADTDVSLRLRHNGKQVLYCPDTRGDPAARMAAIMGAAFSQQAILVEHADKNMRIWGWLGLSELARNQSDRQYFYLNGRTIRDRRVNHAIRLAYAPLLPPGRYPSYVLYLEMDLAAADVNVHPTKHEVRFRQARDVHDFIYASLDRGLKQGVALSLNEEANNAYAPPPLSALPPSYKNTGGLAECSGNYAALMQPRTDKDLLAGVPQAGRPLVQLGGRFILSELAAGFGLIDVKAARRHIAKVRLQAAREVKQRPLLVPVTLTFSADAVQRLSDAARSLQQYGLVLEAVSSTSIMLRALPRVLQDADIPSLLADVLKALDHNGLEALPAVMAEHAGDIEEDRLDMAEMLALLRALEDVGLDIHAKAASGIGRVLTWEDLAGLLHGHG